MKIAVLGSTGSVGTQALDVAEKQNLPVDLICAGRNVTLSEAQIRKFRPRVCVLSDEKAAEDLRLRVADTSTRVYGGSEAVTHQIAASTADVFVNSILGESGLIPTLAVLKTGKRLALANKESLVIAGNIVKATAKQYNAEILPVDSEHSAVFQCLQNGKHSEVKRILLTASGGPFFGYTKEKLAGVTLSDTLAHPTWKMGRKITVDSATLMNKGFEVIEAVHLFDVRPCDVTVVVHRESIIHSAVEYTDNTVIAELSEPDMRSCVQYALSYPDRELGVTKPLDLFSVKTLTFAQPDTDAFPLLTVAFDAIHAGGAVPAVLNAADEIAVDAFLAEKIPFIRISEIVAETVDRLKTSAAAESTLEGILAFDKAARATANALI